MAVDSCAPWSDTDEDRQVEQQLREVEARVLARYPETDHAARDRAVQVLARIRARFAQSRVRTFVPILVERAARAELGD